MAYPRTIRNFNAFVDGTSYFGKVLTGKLPELKIQGASHRGGGMDGPVSIDMGTEAMSAELSFAEWLPELIKKFGKRERFVFRAAALGEQDFMADDHVITCGGRITVVSQGDLEAGKDNPLKLHMEVDYYRIEKNGEVLIEIDIEAGKRIVDGVDQVADIRRAMGI